MGVTAALIAILGVVLSVRSENQCPMECFCSKSLTSVNCQGKGMGDVPADIPLDVEKLFLGHNMISKIPQHIFTKLKNLKYLQLSYNRISTVPSYAFGNLTNLNNILLDHNVIANILPFAFGDLDTLNKVDLRSNHITEITRNAFSGAALLESITLTTNDLNTFDMEAFQGADSVKYLFLSANRFEVIPQVTHLTGLQSLVMEGNQIRNATFPTSFLHLHNLVDVVLSNNPIGALNNNTFVNLQFSNIKKLEISRSKIKSVDNETFSYLTKLQSLKIGQNPLDGDQLEKVLSGLKSSQIVSLDIRSLQLDGKIPSNTFRILRNSSLRYLLMSNNKIRTIPDKAFANLPKLLTIDLSACQIEDVSKTAFQNLAFTLLFLNDNSLNTVPKGLPASIQKLYLNGNNIVSLSDNSFSNMNNVQEIFLSRNGLHELHENCFSGLNNLRKLHLDSNKIATLPRKLFNSLIRLISLDLSKNNLKLIQPTPGLFASLSSLVYLSLADNQCHSLPLDLFKGLSSLMYMRLENNDVGPIFSRDKDSELLRGLTKLKTLDLSNNNITVLRDAAFMDLASLQDIRLQRNKISSWGKDLFASSNSLQKLDLSTNLISTISSESLESIQSLTSMNLSHNPFACTCALQGFCHWMKMKKGLQDKDKTLCNSPSTWHDMQIEKFCLADIDCRDYTMYYIIAGASGGVIFTLILGICLYRNRWFVKLRCYRMSKCFQSNKHHRHYEEIPGEDKVYDAYISYHDLDRDWVAASFLPNIDNGKLNGEAFQGHYKLCFGCRDFPTNKSEVSCIDESIRSSKHAYVILTKHYVDCTLCNFELDQIIQAKIDGWITDYTVVKVGKLTPKKIPKILQRILERHEFIEWPDIKHAENEFKEKLITRLDKEYEVRV